MPGEREVLPHGVHHSPLESPGHRLPPSGRLLRAFVVREQEGRRDGLVQVAGPRGADGHRVQGRALGIVQVVLPDPEGPVGHGFHVRQGQFPQFVGGGVDPPPLVVGADHEHSHVLVLGQTYVGEVALQGTGAVAVGAASLLVRRAGVAAGRVGTHEVMMEVDVLERVGFDGALDHRGAAVGGKADVADLTLGLEGSDCVDEVVVRSVWVIE
mmetsp:Transcript_5367/g.11226  ORF Transcript_5367/g.11226 Transcript_5367/m.11226 type:complete len:212 (+) Transcript_5367:606-1241(+)